MGVKRELVKKAKILVVDDSVEDMQLVSGILVDAGYAVVARNSGAGGIEAFSKDRPDLVLLDIALPKIRGLEVCAKIRKQAGMTFVPIMMLTAPSRHKEMVKAIGLGADDLFRKPFHPTELVARVKAHLHTKRLYDELEISKHRLAALRKGKEGPDRRIVQDLLRGRPGPDPDELAVLRAKFDGLLARMQTAKNRTGTQAAFQVTPAEMGRAAVKAARHRG